MHVHDGRFGRNEWYPDYLSGWYDMWRDRGLSRVRIYHSIDLRPSQRYIQWYVGWAHLVLVGHGDQQDPMAGPIPPDLSDYTPQAPELRQPKDGDLPELHPGGGRRLRRVGGNAKQRHEAHPRE
ncbi:hypothetical protein S83_034581 [Arachis hypogaea]